MPQMSPMNWSILFILFSLIYLIFCVNLYFMNSWKFHSSFLGGEYLSFFLKL